MPYLMLATGVLLIDQITKYIVQLTMLEGQSIPVLKNIFHLTYIHNPGAAFGMLPNKTAFFITSTFLVIFGGLWFFRTLKDDQKLLKFALALVFGGAVGNLIDRVRYGTVVDFFDFRVWPVFNVADVAISVAVILILWDILKNDGKDHPPGQEHLRRVG